VLAGKKIGQGGCSKRPRSSGGKRQPRRRKAGPGGGPPNPADGRSGDGPVAPTVVWMEAGGHEVWEEDARLQEKNGLVDFLVATFRPTGMDSGRGNLGSQQIWEA